MTIFGHYKLKEMNVAFMHYFTTWNINIHINSQIQSIIRYVEIRDIIVVTW